MRINSSKVNAAIMKSVGAVPQTMAFSEVYQGLQTGVIDGTEGPLSNLYTQKQYEVQKQVTLTFHTVTNYVVVTNKAFWEKLPADIRTTLQGDGMRPPQQPELDQGRADRDRRHQGVRQARISHPAEKEMWMKAMPVQDEMASRVKKETITMIPKVAGKAK